MKLEQLEQENKDSEFTYLQQVKIISGFYSGYYGIVKDIIKDKYVVETKIKDKTIIVLCSNIQIRKVATFWKK